MKNFKLKLLLYSFLLMVGVFSLKAHDFVTIDGTGANPNDVINTGTINFKNGLSVKGVTLTGSFGDLAGKPTTISGYGITDSLVYTTTNYANPSWITSFAWSKLTGVPTTLSGYGITDPIVLTSGAYSNPTWITGLAWSKISGTPTTLSGYGITDPIVLTSGAYSDPSWITHLAWSKLTSTPTTLSGYGITDPIVLTSGAYSNPAWITGLAYSKITGSPISISTNTGSITAGTSVLTWNSTTTINTGAGAQLDTDGTLAADSATRVPSQSAVVTYVTGKTMAIVNVAGTTQACAVQTTYIAANGSTQVVFTLPTTAAVGQEVQIVGGAAGGWKLAQNASQLIHSNSATTTTGTGGYLSSTNGYNCVRVMCVSSDGHTWVVENFNGSLNSN